MKKLIASIVAGVVVAGALLAGSAGEAAVSGCQPTLIASTNPSAIGEKVSFSGECYTSARAEYYWAVEYENGTSISLGNVLTPVAGQISFAFTFLEAGDFRVSTYKVSRGKILHQEVLITQTVQ